MRIGHCTHERHAAAILDILNEAIVNTTALYDYKRRTPQSMRGWFDSKEKGLFPVIGAFDSNDNLLGFASYGPFRNWPAYKYTVEHSVYVHRDHRGKGISVLLMRRLIELAIEQQHHVLIGAIDASNHVSCSLHEKLGFSLAGTIRQAGFKFGRWLDLALYQIVLQTPQQPEDG